MIRFKGFINQSGTAAPTVNANGSVDQIGVTFARSSAGVYTASAPGMFTEGLTHVSICDNVPGLVQIKAGWVDDSTIEIYTSNAAGVGVDGLMSNIPFYIEVE